MKIKITPLLTAGTLVMVIYTSCHKHDTPTLNDTESKLVGTWLTRKITVEQTGQPPMVMSGINDACYYIIFKNAPYPHSNSGLYTNTKWAEDWKDCSKKLNAWKVDNNGKLLLASLDTLYADILILEKDTLAFKTTSPGNPDQHITYEFR